MALRTETIEFDAERDRLTERMEELAERQVEYQQSAEETDSEEIREQKQRQARQLLQEGNRLENQREVLAAIENGDIDGLPAFESVELAGLTTGDVNRVEDVAEEHESVRERDAWVAIGTQDAPYLEHDPGEIVHAAFEDTVRAVTDLPLPYVQWAEAKIADLSHLGADEGNGYLALVREMREA